LLSFLPPEVILFLKPIWLFVQGLLIVGVPALTIGWKIFWDKQRKQDSDIEATKKRLDDSDKEISALHDRLKTLELTAVTEKRLNELLKEVSTDMERKINSLKQDIKDIMREFFSSTHK